MGEPKVKPREGNRSIVEPTSDTIGMERTPKKDLYSVASTCVTRLIKELKYYFGTPNDDQLLAMAVNPFVASWGFPIYSRKSGGCFFAG